LCGGISEIKNGYQPRKNIVKDEKGDLVTDAYSILDMRRNRLCYFLNIRMFNDVTQTEMHTADPIVPESSAFVFKVVIERTKRHKSPDTEQIPAELFKQTVGQFLLKSVNLHNTDKHKHTIV